MIPWISRNCRDYEPQISHSLPIALSNSRSLPVKRECDFQFPFPGAKKPFPLTPMPWAHEGSNPYIGQVPSCWNENSDATFFFRLVRTFLNTSV